MGLAEAEYYLEKEAAKKQGTRTFVKARKKGVKDAFDADNAMKLQDEALSGRQKRGIKNGTITPLAIEDSGSFTHGNKASEPTAKASKVKTKAVRKTITSRRIARAKNKVLAAAEKKLQQDKNAGRSTVNSENRVEKKKVQLNNALSNHQTNRIVQTNATNKFNKQTTGAGETAQAKAKELERIEAKRAAQSAANSSTAAKNVEKLTDNYKPEVETKASETAGKNTAKEAANFFSKHKGKIGLGAGAAALAGVGAYAYNRDRKRG